MDMEELEVTLKILEVDYNRINKNSMYINMRDNIVKEFVCQVLNKNNFIYFNSYSGFEDNYIIYFVAK